MQCFVYKTGFWFCFQKFLIQPLPGKIQEQILFMSHSVCSTSIATQLFTRKDTIDDSGCLYITVKLQLYKVTTVILDSYQGE